MKAKQVKVDVKEIRFGPQTDDHDYNFKLKHAQGFLSEGDKVKAYVFFKGRSILFKEQGEVLLLRFANDLEEYGKVEQMPVLEGKRMTIFISPKKQQARKPAEPASEAAPQKVERSQPKANAPKGIQGAARGRRGGLTRKSDETVRNALVYALPHIRIIN